MARRGDTIELAVLGLLHEGPMHGDEPAPVDRTTTQTPQADQH